MCDLACEPGGWIHSGPTPRVTAHVFLMQQRRSVLLWLNWHCTGVAITDPTSDFDTGRSCVVWTSQVAVQSNRMACACTSACAHGLTEPLTAAQWLMLGWRNSLQYPIRERTEAARLKPFSCISTSALSSSLTSCMRRACPLVNAAACCLLSWRA